MTHDSYNNHAGSPCTTAVDCGCCISPSTSPSPLLQTPPTPSTPTQLGLGPRRSSSTKHHRPSFSSVREDDSGCAQSFVVSSFGSSAPTVECKSPCSPRAEAFDTTTTGDTMASTLTLQAPAVYCPCQHHFDGWKHIRLRGKGLSKSSGDLRLLRRDSVEDTLPTVSTVEIPCPSVEEKDPAPYPAGESPLERLPNEILDDIMSFLENSSPYDGVMTRKNDLMSCMLTSKSLLAIALPSLYRNVMIPRSVVFSKLREQLGRFAPLGECVRRLDFSHFSSVGLGRTRRMNSEIQMVTAETLAACLEQTPQLHEFLAQAHLDTDLDGRVIKKLLYGLPQLDALDFCASSSEPFRTGFAAALEPGTGSASLSLKRLSLHECSTLASSTLERLFPRLTSLTHLDVAHTQVTDEILRSLPRTARLTHLNLSGCTHLSGAGVVGFFKSHAAVTNSLVYLNLLSDVFRYCLLSESDVEMLLPLLPSTLKSLNLSGAKLNASHLPALFPLTRHLEELSIGYASMTMDEITSLFIPSSPRLCSEDEDVEMEDSDTAPWAPSSLHYLDVTGVHGVTASRLLSESCPLLWGISQPLEVLEIGEKVLAGLHQRSKISKKLGWTVKEAGRRAWYVRELAQKSDPWLSDSGRRSWKMGAMWWGMRKIPVADSDVGGLYGHYMFKYKPAN